MAAAAALAVLLANATLDQREKVCDLIKAKIKDKIDDESAKDLEIGIYNWCIEFCDTKKIFKSWKNPRFVLTYMERARGIICNLNPDSYIGNSKLITRLNNNEFKPHEVGFMKADMLYPEKWKDTTDEFLKKFEHAYENRLESMSSDFKCVRCKKRECVYYTLQTKSADESETIFIKCINCSHSWKQG